MTAATLMVMISKNSIKKGGDTVKKSFSFKKSIGRKNLILSAVSLLLVVLLSVTATASWIEEVSQVEFSSTEGQETPLHVGSKVLNSDAVMKDNPTIDTVALSDYFYESGDMHLSPCYGDGDNFYFPLEGGGSGYRVGTKDDANTNYLSATFHIRSEGANTAYWFEKSVVNNNELPFITFKNGNTASTQFLRCSVTIDGATNVYALNSTGQYITRINGSNQTVTGKRIDEYTYYGETFYEGTITAEAGHNPEGYYKNSVNVNNKPNQGAGNNLNGNTLFNVNKYDSHNRTGVKTVTVKIWLEYNSSSPNNAAVNVASVNMNFVSSWAKTRRIYVKDCTVHEEGYDCERWLPTYYSKLYFAVKNDLTNRHWELTRIGNSDYYYTDDIPAVYNNTEAVFFRCSNSGWNNGNKEYSANGVTVNCWNYWETTFPDTFHSEVYSVFSSKYATWDGEDVSAVYFVNSGNFGEQKAYMWDSSSVYDTGVNAKVVKNADWPGVDMTQLKENSAKGWPFPISTSQNNSANCKLSTGSDGGYFTFIFSKDSNDNYFLLVRFYGNNQPSFVTYGDSSFYVVGGFNSWATNANSRMKKLSDTSYVCTINMSANQTYDFKIRNGSTYYSNSGTIDLSNDTDNNNFGLYTFHYSSDYDYAVFSDGVADGENKEYQTQDLMVKNRNNPSEDWSNKTFDMATLTWFDATPNNKANLPYYSSNNTYLDGNFSTGGRWNQTRFAYGGQYAPLTKYGFGGTSESHMMCKRYIKGAGDYQFVVHYNGTTYKPHKDYCNLYKDGYIDLYPQDNGDHNGNAYAKDLVKGQIYRFYLDPQNGYLRLYLYQGEN